MKKLTFFLGIAIAILVSANFAGAAQIIDDALHVNSLKVGQQGLGGVTYFNGTIINETTDENGDGMPVTFGDDVRIDGRLYRGATAGISDSSPFIINDNLEVVGSLTVGSTNILSAINAKGAGDMLKSTYDIAGNGMIDAAKLDSGIAATLLALGTISNAEYGYLNGVTSNIQTQLNTKGTGDMLKSTYDAAGNGKIDAGNLDSGIIATLIGTGTVTNIMFNNLTDLNLDDSNDKHLTALGVNAGDAIESSGFYNTFIGYQTGDATTTGDNNTAIGWDALGANITGSDNTAIGSRSMAATNGTSTRNVAIGASAFDANLNGVWNTVIGWGALGNGTNVDSSVALGYLALSGASGDNNIAIGYQAGNNIIAGTNNLIIGHDIDAPSASGNYQLNIGDIIKGSLDPAAPGLSIDSGFALTPSTDQTRAATSTITIDNGIVRVVSDGGAITLGNPAIEDGSADGQIIIIQGTHDTNTVQVPDSANTALVGDTAFTLGDGDNIQLMWDLDDSIWYEISRANN